MPPAIQEGDPGRPRLPLQPVRGGLISIGTGNTYHNPQNPYNSPYGTPESSPLGLSRPSSLSIRQPSRNIQSSGFYGHAHGEHLPELPSTSNRGSRPHLQENYPVYQSPGSSTQRVTNPILPPQNHRVVYQHVYQQAQPLEPALSNSSRSYEWDFPRRNALDAVRNSCYISPYRRDSKEMSREYSFTPFYSDAEEQMVSSHTKPQVHSRVLPLVPGTQYDLVQPQRPPLQVMQSLPSSSEPSIYPSSSPSPAPSTLSAPSRRGRPPGKKAIKPSKLAIEIHSTPPAKPRGRPSKNKAKATPSNSLPVPPGSNSGKKKRGRPFKSAETAAKAIAKAKGEHVPGRRGRPMKVRIQTSIAVPLAEYVAFGCQWEGCEAELHNLETLKKHVKAVHGKRGGPEELVCAWKKSKKHKVGIQDTEDVGENDKDNDEGKAVCKSIVFTSWKERNEHLEKVHFWPFAWHMGDGPKATCLELRVKTIDPWLLDANGVQVTPSIEGQLVEGGIAKYKNKQRWLNEMKRLNINIKKGAASSSFMKTPAQLALEKNADTNSPSGSVSGSGDMETGNEEGDESMGTGDENGNDQNGEHNDVEMDGGLEEVEFAMQDVRRSIEESEVDDDGDELPVLDRL